MFLKKTILALLKKGFIYNYLVKLDLYRKSKIGEVCNRHQWIKKLYLKRRFKNRLGYDLNFDECPKTFNQKIQFRKIFDNNPLYSVCSSKLSVRNYVNQQIGEKFLVPLHLVTDELREEDWEKLPNQCVIKATHNSGPVQIVLDKENTNKTKLLKEINRQLTQKYGPISLQGSYDDIPPMVIVETLLKTEQGGIPEDYKFHCFNQGNDIFIQIDTGRYSTHTQDFFDENWVNLNLEVLVSNSVNPPSKPADLLHLVEIARKLSADFDYVRVDLYNVESKIFFGELTFCPWGGLTKFKPFEWDEKWGKLWQQKIVR